jgi:hypothetical protein
MLTSSRVMMIKDKIVDYHGRVENIRLFDKEPPPPEGSIKQEDLENSSKKKTKKQREAEEEEALTREAIVTHKEYHDEALTLFEILGGHWGSEDKEDAEEMDLWYDFTPYNSKDPILLCLMARDHK